MKTISLLIHGLLISISLSANNQLKVNEHTTVHLVCPVAVSYVQVGSSEHLIAEAVVDYPNIVRIKAVQKFQEGSSLTIVCQDKLYAFEVSYQSSCPLQLKLSDYHGEALKQIATSTLPLHQVQACIYRMQTRQTRKPIEKVEKDNVTLTLEEITLKHDLVFIRLCVTNNSNTIYKADTPTFMMRDKRPKRAANVQEYPLEPFQTVPKTLYVLPQEECITILVFKTFSIPRHKEVEVMLQEETEAYTGRDMHLSFDNKAIQGAQAL